MEQNKDVINSYLRRISNFLIINGVFLHNPGLLTGKMGLAVFFCHYARYTQNEVYLQYSFDLIEKIQNNIYQKSFGNYC